MERRVDKRRARRVPVRFWRKGETKARTGFTTNISNCGMFIGSNVVLGRGARVRIEVLDAQHGFILEGVVARAIRSKPPFQSVQPSGMGIRFLQVAELVEDLFPGSQPREPLPENEGSTETASSPPTPRPAYSVQFRSLEEFRTCYERDLSKGGLFVTTPEPAPLQQVLTIEIRVAESTVPPVLLQARVVHCVESPDGEEVNLLAGVGLEILEPVQAQKALRPLLEA